ncbi:MAG: DegV family protein [Lachnospiraceae bacterium]|nr:DegV family protein [Lachnospiraceae bacterium]
MGDYIISCSSTADLTDAHFKARDIHYICFHFSMDGTDYFDDLGQSMPFPEFYQRMTKGADTRTSQINVEEYQNYFENFLKAGKDVIHLTLSTGISGTYNSAVIAADELREKYPERKLYVIDSLAAASGYGLLMDKLADLRDDGMSIDELATWAEENKLRASHWFFSSDLTFFIKGGRISKTAGFVGSALGICPLMNVDYQGKLIPREKIRTKKKVIRRIVEVMKETCDGGLDYSDNVYISHAACREDAEAIAALVRETFPKAKTPEIYDIGTTIGSHTGPGTATLFFWGNDRVVEKAAKEAAGEK